MVNRITFFLLMGFLLMACNKTLFEQTEDSNKESNTMYEEKVWTDKEKDIEDEIFFKSLEKVEISEEGFLAISKYVIETAKKRDFKEVDPILGKKERMYSKDFKDPYISYHYVHIPYYPSIEVYLKYRKDDNKLVMISLNRAGTAGGLSFKEYKLNTLEQLNLQVIKKELSADSNQIYKYQLSDENFRYEVYGKDNIDNQPPKEFYDFRILTSGI